MWEVPSPCLCCFNVCCDIVTIPYTKKTHYCFRLPFNQIIFLQIIPG